MCKSFDEIFLEVFGQGKQDCERGELPKSENQDYLDGYGEAYAEAEIQSALSGE